MIIANVVRYEKRKEGLTTPTDEDEGETSENQDNFIASKLSNTSHTRASDTLEIENLIKPRLAHFSSSSHASKEMSCLCFVFVL